MTLKEYMAVNGVTQKELGEKMGVTQGFVSQLLIGTSEVPAYRALQIQKITKGRVKVGDLIDLAVKN